MGVVINPKMDAILTTLGKIKDDIKGLGFAAKGSGDIVSFPDSIGGFNVNRIVADLAPVQLGSGDPSPSNIRPILGHTEVETTGTGKNLFDGAFRQGAAISLASTTRVVSSHLIFVKRGYTYTFSASNYTTFNYVLNSSPTGTLPFSSSNYSYCGTATAWVGNKITFTATNDGYVAINVKKVGDGDIVPADVASVNMQFEIGSTATTYAPYIGTSVLTEIGINQWDEEWRVGAFNGSGDFVTGYNYVCSKNRIPVTPSTTYGLTKTVRIWQYDANGTYISGGGGQYTGSFTTDSNARYINFRDNVESTVYNHDVGINYPSRFTSYYPYTGIGQVYGGTLDVTSGKLTATMRVLSTAGLVAANISTVQTVGSLTRFWLYVANKTVGDVQCDRIATSTGSTYGQEVVDMYGADPNYPQSIWTKLPTSLVGTTAASILTYLQTSGIQIAYTLATPIVYQLEPQDVQTVLGQNNIYTDSGEVNVWYVAGLS